MLTDIRQQLLDILNIELETQRTLAHARSAAAEAINHYFRSKTTESPGKPPEYVRIAIQFTARPIPILNHACRVNMKPLPAQPESKLHTVTNTLARTERTYKKRPAKKHR